MAATAAAQSENPQHVEIGIDLTRGLSFGNSDTFRREKYFNVHGTPGELSKTERAQFTDELRVNFGRSMGAISSFMARLKEDPSRPGFADPKSLAKRVARYADRHHSDTVPRSSRFEIVHSVHPYSYYGKPDEDGDHRIPFVPGSHEAAAEILSAFFSAVDVSQQPYFEVANEGNVKARSLGTTFEDMCDLHATIAQRLHRDVPGLKVGGPASAWPAFEVKDFRIWREQMGLFIDRAGKEMDFLSVHLYTTHWDDKVNDRFGANIDAIVDLMENQSLLSTGEVKPLLISECGTGLRDGEKIFNDYSPERDWLILRGANHVFLNLLRRDDRLLKVIPFLVLRATWFDSKFPYPWVLFHRDGDQWVRTHLLKWYQFWKDVQGRHVPTICSSLDVQTHALLDGDSAFILVDNLMNEVANIRLTEALPKGIDVEAVSISRLFYDGNNPMLVQNQQLTADWRQVQLRPHEAIILRLQLNEPPPLTSTLVESTTYGDRTVQPITTKATHFQLGCDAELDRVDSAILRVGYGRNKSLSREFRVLVNGSAVKVTDEERGEGTLNGDIDFKTREVAVPVQLLRKQNRVSVRFAEPGGHLSSVVLIVREEQFRDLATKEPGGDGKRTLE